MICEKCRGTIPDESTFCLSCGARLVPVERLAPVNGGKGGRPVGATAGASLRPAAVQTSRSTRAPGGKEPYALSFHPLSDEGLRRRVARWLCEVAPAHHLTEVQARLKAGGFGTVLALTPAEADATRERIQALGAHPGFWQLKPATMAELLFQAGPRDAQRKGLTTYHKIAVAIGLLVFAVCVVFSWMQYTSIMAKAPAKPGGVPRIGVSR